MCEVVKENLDSIKTVEPESEESAILRKNDIVALTNFKEQKKSHFCVIHINTSIRYIFHLLQQLFAMSFRKDHGLEPEVRIEPQASVGYEKVGRIE